MCIPHTACPNSPEQSRIEYNTQRLARMHTAFADGSRGCRKCRKPLLFPPIPHTTSEQTHPSEAAAPTYDTTTLLGIASWTVLRQLHYPERCQPKAWCAGLLEHCYKVTTEAGVLLPSPEPGPLNPEPWTQVQEADPKHGLSPAWRNAACNPRLPLCSTFIPPAAPDKTCGTCWDTFAAALEHSGPDMCVCAGGVV